MNSQQNRSYVKKANSNFQPNSFSYATSGSNSEDMSQANLTREAAEKENEMEWLEDDNLDEDALFGKQIDKEKIKKQLESGEYKPKSDEESRQQRNISQNQSSNNYYLNNQMNKQNNHNNNYQKGYKPGPQNLYQENPYQNNSQAFNHFNPGYNPQPKSNPNFSHKQQQFQGNQQYYQNQHSQYAQQQQQQQQQYGVGNQFRSQQQQQQQQQWQQQQQQVPIQGQYQYQQKQNNQGYSQQKYYQQQQQPSQHQQQLQNMNPYYQQQWQQQWLAQQQWQQQLLLQQQMEEQSNNQSQSNILFSDYVIENQHDASELLWYFKDVQQITYGPYCSYDMDTWYNFRALNDDILVAFDQPRNFVPVKEFFNFVKPANKDKETQEEQDILEQKLLNLGLSGKDRLIFQSPQDKP